MAKDNDTRDAPKDGMPGAINALLNLKGAIRLARQTVLDEAGPNEELSAAEGVLTFAENEAERIYAWLEADSRLQQRDVHPFEEVAHG